MAFSAGLLGAFKGAGEGVSQISQEQRKNLAEKLKMQAVEEMNTRMAGYENKLAMSRQGQQQEFEKGLSESRIEAGKYTTEANIKSAEKIAKMRADLEAQKMNVDKKSDQARILQVKSKAASDAMNLINKGGSVEDANQILEAAGLPLLEEYTIDEGSKGFLGFGKEPPTTGIRRKGSGGLLQAEEQPKKTNLKSDLDRLLSLGSKSMGGQEPEPDMTDEPPQKPKGILSDYSAVPVSQPGDLGDPSTWDVRQQSGKYFIITKEGPREMTPDQIQQWKATQKGM